MTPDSVGVEVELWLSLALPDEELKSLRANLSTFLVSLRKTGSGRYPGQGRP